MAARKLRGGYLTRYTDDVARVLGRPASAFAQFAQFAQEHAALLQRQARLVRCSA